MGKTGKSGHAAHRRKRRLMIPPLEWGGEDQPVPASMGHHPIITLLTDFGHQDPFVGIMKGVILGLCPKAVLVDLVTKQLPMMF